MMLIVVSIIPDKHQHVSISEHVSMLNCIYWGLFSAADQHSFAVRHSKMKSEIRGLPIKITAECVEHVFIKDVQYVHELSTNF